MCPDGGVCQVVYGEGGCNLLVSSRSWQEKLKESDERKKQELEQLKVSEEGVFGRGK